MCTALHPRRPIYCVLLLVAIGVLSAEPAFARRRVARTPVPAGPALEEIVAEMQKPLPPLEQTDVPHLLVLQQPPALGAIEASPWPGRLMTLLVYATLLVFGWCIATSRLPRLRLSAPRAAAAPQRKPPAVAGSIRPATKAVGQARASRASSETRHVRAPRARTTEALPMAPAPPAVQPPQPKAAAPAAVPPGPLAPQVRADVARPAATPEGKQLQPKVRKSLDGWRDLLPPRPRPIVSQVPEVSAVQSTAGDAPSKARAGFDSWRDLFPSRVRPAPPPPVAPIQSTAPEPLSKAQIIHFKSLESFDSWRALLTAARAGNRVAREALDSSPAHAAVKFQLTSADFTTDFGYVRNIVLSPAWVAVILDLLRSTERFDAQLTITSPFGRQQELSLEARIDALNAVLGYEELPAHVRRQLELRRWILWQTRTDGVERPEILASFAQKARASACAAG